MLKAVPSDAITYSVKFDKNNEPLHEDVSRAETKAFMIKVKLSKYVIDHYVRLRIRWCGPGMRCNLLLRLYDWDAGLAGGGPNPGPGWAARRRFSPGGNTRLVRGLAT